MRMRWELTRKSEGCFKARLESPTAGRRLRHVFFGLAASAHKHVHKGDPSLRRYRTGAWSAGRACSKSFWDTQVATVGVCAAQEGSARTYTRALFVVCCLLLFLVEGWECSQHQIPRFCALFCAFWVFIWDVFLVCKLFVPLSCYHFSSV